MIGQRPGFTSLRKLTFGAKYCFFDVKMYIRMGITMFKILIWGGILSFIWLEIMFLCCGVAVKQHFRPYIRTIKQVFI